MKLVLMKNSKKVIKLSFHSTWLPFQDGGISSKGAYKLVDEIKVPLNP